MTHCLVHFHSSAKNHQNIPKGIRVTEWTQIFFQIIQRVITPKVRKAELSFLYATCRLVLFYISTKYHQTIQVTEWTTSFTPTGSVPKTMSPHPTPTLVGGDIHTCTMIVILTLQFRNCPAQRKNSSIARQSKNSYFVQYNSGIVQILTLGKTKILNMKKK